MMEGFAPIGGLVGLAATLLLLLNGRIAGISGIINGLLTSKGPDTGPRAMFVVGLMLGASGYALATGGGISVTPQASVPVILVAGLLVGFGARLAPVAPAATAVFFGVAALTVLSYPPRSLKEDDVPRMVAALFSGTLFGLGLAASGVTDPATVVGFLDVAGAWDPTVAFLFGGAALVTIPAFRLILKRPGPVLADGFALPTKSDLDARLLGGATLSGIGRGLAGFCPGPALVARCAPVFAFVAAMLLYRLTFESPAGRARTSA